MNELLEIQKTRVLLCAKEGPLLAAAADANDFLSEASAADVDLLAVPVERLGQDFLKLSTGVAGEVFQKFVNYRRKCAFVGDISSQLEGSRALRDFVRETNKGNSIWFVPDLDQLRAKLTGAPRA